MPTQEDPTADRTAPPRMHGIRADDMLDVSSFENGDIVAVTTMYSTYTFAMVDVRHRLARLWITSGDTISKCAYATIMGSVFDQESSSGFYGRICLGFHLEIHTHRQARPEIVVLQPRVATSVIREVRVNGDLILPRPADAEMN